MGDCDGYCNKDIEEGLFVDTIMLVTNLIIVSYGKLYVDC